VASVSLSTPINYSRRGRAELPDLNGIASCHGSVSQGDRWLRNPAPLPENLGAGQDQPWKTKEAGIYLAGRPNGAKYRIANWVLRNLLRRSLFGSSVPNPSLSRIPGYKSAFVALQPGQEGLNAEGTMKR
jgi:hypothetical protein